MKTELWKDLQKGTKKTGSGYVRHKGSTPHMTDNQHTMHHI
jgi:hypothetical protein